MPYFSFVVCIIFFLFYIPDLDCKYGRCSHSERRSDSRFSQDKGELFENSKQLRGFFDDYRRLDRIHQYLKDLAKINPKTAKVITIGKSNENRKLLVIQISSNLSESKPVIFLEGGLHGREWIGPPTVIYIATKLQQASKSEKDLIENFRWDILPVANPDGYEFSHTNERKWRKNRRKTKNSECLGVDLNRNWDFHWNGGGGSLDPCNELYSGTSGFSEPETRSISQFILKTQKKQKYAAFLAFHSFGEEWGYPFAWTHKPPDDQKDLVAMAKVAVDALSKVRGSKYGVEQTSHMTAVGIASGGADDWTKGVANVKYSYTIELPKNDFELPKEEIKVVGKELWEAVKALARAIKDKDKI